ncbi:ABC transporter ATP-binding protein [Agrilactobacillus yilanensis]|uniref:ABC transporter ATP-binding protein n=1 Tax=Agrilactobacillus yilanensis TaxID=2485997 RepID=A0ABW4J8D8_9LACO|nr:ABC transporter ATP-binding protein [Agrilactobacillus yilanensis]
MAILEVSNVQFNYPKGPQCLDQVNLALNTGEITTILGPNGVGKSTFLQLLCGLLQPTGGEITLNGCAMDSLSPAKRAQTIALVPQMNQIAGLPYTVLDYLLMGKTASMGLFHKPQSADYQAAEKVLQRLNCSQLLERSCASLSGGQLQLVTVGKALMQKPKLLLLDEPTAALDYKNQVEILRLLKDLAHSGLAIALTSHDPNQAILLEDRVALLDKTGHLRVGPMTTMISAENLSQIYETDLTVTFVPNCQRLVCTLMI